MTSPPEPRGGRIGAIMQIARSTADRVSRVLSRRSAIPGTDGFSSGVVSHVGPDGLHVTMGPDGLYQWRADLGSGWRNSAVAYRCIVAIATNAATTPLEVINEDGEVLPDEVADLWNHQPNNYMSARVLREICWLRLETSGQSFVFMDRGESGQGPVSSLHVLDSGGTVQPIVDNTNPEVWDELVGYRIYGANGAAGVLLPEE